MWKQRWRIFEIFSFHSSLTNIIIFSYTIINYVIHFLPKDHIYVCRRAFHCLNLFFSIEIWKERIAGSHSQITNLREFQVQIQINTLHGHICNEWTRNIKDYQLHMLSYVCINSHICQWSLFIDKNIGRSCGKKTHYFGCRNRHIVLSLFDFCTYLDILQILNWLKSDPCKLV